MADQEELITTAESEEVHEIQEDTAETHRVVTEETQEISAGDHEGSNDGEIVAVEDEVADHPSVDVDSINQVPTLVDNNSADLITLGDSKSGGEEEKDDRPVTASEIIVQTDAIEVKAEAPNLPELGEDRSAAEVKLDEFFEEQPEVDEAVDYIQESDEQDAQPKLIVWIKSLDPRVVKLLYWEDLKESGITFGALLILLFAMKLNSLLSVCCFFGLAILIVTFACRVLAILMQVLHKKPSQNPFQDLLDKEITIPKAKVIHLVEDALDTSVSMIKRLRDLLLVIDIVESLQFGLMLWLLSFVGGWMSDLTIIIIAVIAVFSVPVCYEHNQTQIDAYLNVARAELNKVLAQVDGLIPGRNTKQKEE